MAISTNTLDLAIAVLKHESERIAALVTADDTEASYNGHVILDISCVLCELRNIKKQGTSG